MKVKVFFTALVCSMVGMSACSDDDNYVPENVVNNSFESKYPGAQRVEWETKQGYKVVDFYFQAAETEAWFQEDGTWVFTETDVLFENLPDAVKTSFNATQYASWRVDDVDKLERPEAEVVYVIEVEKGKEEYDLYYAADGTLIKEIADGAHTTYQPNTVSSALIEKVMQMYPGAKIYDIEREGTRIEVDIVDGKTHKDVAFNDNEAWVYTEWEIRTSDVPDVVMNALKSSEYKDYRIDDVDVYDTPQGLFYKFELESGNKEVNVFYKADGTVSTFNEILGN